VRVRGRGGDKALHSRNYVKINNLSPLGTVKRGDSAAKKKKLLYWTGFKKKKKATTFINKSLGGTLVATGGISRKKK